MPCSPLQNGGNNSSPRHPLCRSTRDFSKRLGGFSQPRETPQGAGGSIRPNHPTPTFKKSRRSRCPPKRPSGRQSDPEPKVSASMLIAPTDRVRGPEPGPPRAVRAGLRGAARRPRLPPLAGGAGHAAGLPATPDRPRPARRPGRWALFGQPCPSGGPFGLESSGLGWRQCEPPHKKCTLSQLHNPLKNSQPPKLAIFDHFLSDLGPLWVANFD